MVSSPREAAERREVQPTGRHRAFIVDFAARSHKLVIELDGETHGGNEARDAQRAAVIEQQGYRVIRFTNADVMRNEAAVLDAIVAALVTAPLPDPLPASGEREQ